MITIGDVCPLFFDVLKYEHANKGSFRQCFNTSDGIILQVFSNDGEQPTATINDKINGTSSNIEFDTYQVNDSITMYYKTLYPTDGIYSVKVGEKGSEVFEVCENSNGALIEYTHKDNNSVFDNIFWNDTEQFVFKFRVPGGFKPSGVSIEVDNEQFVNQKQEIVELYAIPYITKTFSIGDSNGVPYYVAELINKILCLSDVRINGESYNRENNSKPEVSETIGRKELFMYTINLRPSQNTISGIGGKVEEGVTASAVGFSIKNAKEGEVLVYDSDESAFVNSNTLNSL